ncbi:MAG: ECF transporter S component [Actinomycetia bacterium]|nr:ECF transporter S component [Actinomycetes bacterium]
MSDESVQPSRLSRLLDILEPLLLIVVPLVLATSALLRFQQTALLSAVVALVALLPFFLRFEGAGVQPRDIMPIVVMAAIAIALRILLTPLPNFKPVSAIVIITGLGFGKRSGFMTGALVAVVSNMFLGQGPWTPWQMYLWGLMGYLAGALSGTRLLRQRWQVVIFGAVMALFYGLIMDTYSVFGFLGAQTMEAALAIYAAGLIFGISHIISTALFLWLIYKPWMHKLERIKVKYGIGEQRTKAVVSAD